MPNRARQLEETEPSRQSSKARSLKVVTEDDQPKGDASLTQEAMASWREGQRRCRARKRHNWGPYTVWEYRNHYLVVEQCSHCRNRRSAEFVKTAFGLRKATDWQPEYREGYLLPRGAMRITEDLHDELTAADILSRKILEAPDYEDD